MALTFNIKAICTLTGFLKIVEIILAFICIALLRQYSLDFGAGSRDGATAEDRQLVGIIAIGSSILISMPLLIAYVFFAHASDLLEILFCFTAAVMNIAGGAMAINNYQHAGSSDHAKAGLAMGSLMIINALAYLIDAGTGTIASHK